MIKYIITPLSVSNKEAFTEASREELRVLIALIECDGIFDSAEALAKRASVSKTRCSSALVLWEESEVIKKSAESDGAVSASVSITEEFEDRLRKGEIAPEDAADVAKTIRDNSLRDMISEISAIMKRSALNTEEIKSITALYMQYALSEEYIITLASFLAKEGRLTATKLVNKAIALTEKEIDTLSSLVEYISNSESYSEAERLFRSIFGIYGRAVSKSEKEYFRKWSKDYGYYADIVGEAYDIAVSSVSRGYAKYADRLLTRWHEAGCKTLEECRSTYEKDSAEKRAEFEAKRTSSHGAKSSKAEQKEKPRYGDFDVNEAFLAALERSYADDDDGSDDED